MFTNWYANNDNDDNYGCGGSGDDKRLLLMKRTKPTML